MKRKELEDLGLSKEQADAVIKINGADIENAKATSAAEITNLTTENDSLNKQIKERDKQLEDVKKSSGDNEELKKQIEELQEQNNTAKQQYEADIKKVKIENAVQAALRDAGAINPKLAAALLSDMDKAEIAEDGTVKGLSEQIDAIQKSDSYLFKAAQEPNKPAGASPASTGPQQPPTGAKKLEDMTYEDFVAQLESK